MARLCCVSGVAICFVRGVLDCGALVTTAGVNGARSNKYALSKPSAGGRQN
jgi:hypothetical protein